MAIPVAAAIGGLLSGIGALAGIGRGARQNKRNVRNMRLQYEMDKQMFDYQNAYNTPAMQMQRLKDAGLNPALMYGQGTTGNATGYPQTKPLPAYQETPVDTRTILEGVNLAMQNKILKEQGKGLEIDNYIKAGGSQYDIRQKLLNNEKTEKEIDQLGESINNLKADTSLKKEAKRELQQKIENLKTTDEWNKVKKSLDSLKEARAKKGVIPGDTFGNILEALNIDPSTESGKTQIQILFYGYFGVQLGTQIFNSYINSLKL